MCLLEVNVCERVFYCPHYTAADVSPPVRSHHCITRLMSPHQSGITAVNVINEMLEVDSRQDRVTMSDLAVKTNISQCTFFFIAKCLIHQALLNTAG